MSGNPGGGVIIIGTLVIREPERLPLSTQQRLKAIARHADAGLPLTIPERLFVAKAVFVYLSLGGYPPQRA